jgi:hypothetical protein
VEAIETSGTGARGIVNVGIFGGGVLFARIESIEVRNDNGVAIGDFSAGASGHTHVRVGDVYLEADGAIGVSRTVAGSTVGSIEHILEVGGQGTGTLGFSVTSGNVDMSVQTLEVDTAGIVNSPGQVNLFVNRDSSGAGFGGTGSINVTNA